jgi:hypothetical protein
MKTSIFSMALGFAVGVLLTGAIAFALKLFF